MTGPRYRPFKGVLSHERCPECGQRLWAMTVGEPGNRVNVSICPRCDQPHSRLPRMVDDEGKRVKGAEKYLPREHPDHEGRPRPATDIGVGIAIGLALLGVLAFLWAIHPLAALVVPLIFIRWWRSG